uniref:Uncharacterized protein n=1 Tax=Glossina palpalis gambiensis TaxID=67801 RepID=A0A1B0BYS3_9MUSC
MTPSTEKAIFLKSFEEKDVNPDCESGTVTRTKLMVVATFSLSEALNCLSRKTMLAFVTVPFLLHTCHIVFRNSMTQVHCLNSQHVRVTYKGVYHKLKYMQSLVEGKGTECASKLSDSVN